MRAVELAWHQLQAVQLTGLWRAQVDQQSFLLRRAMRGLCQHLLRRPRRPILLPLVELSLGRNGIGDKGIVALAKARVGGGNDFSR